jgi:CRISPR-associated protein Cas2
MKFEDLRRKLLKEIDKEEDNLRLYRLTEPREGHVETYGMTRTVFFDDEPLIV